MGFRLVLFLTLAAWTSPVWGLDSSTVWEPFGRDQGLSGSAVTSMVQDSRGFLWIGTQTGLNRWDGVTMRVWQKEPFRAGSLGHNLIQTLYLDGGTVLWIGTYGGLDRFDTRTETFRHFGRVEDRPDSLSHDVVTRIFRDHLGTLWVGTLDGLNRLDEVSGAFRRFPSEGQPGGLSGRTVRTLAEDAGGQLWVGSSGGLDVFNEAQTELIPVRRRFPTTNLPPGAVMAALRTPGSDDLWLAVWGQGLVRFHPGDGRAEVFPLGEDRLFSLTLGQGGTLEVGTWGGGLVVFDPATQKVTRLRHDPQRADSLAHDVVYGTFTDRDGLVWALTNGGGISRYNPRRQRFGFEPFPGRVPVVLAQADGTLWLSPYNAGLVRISPSGAETRWTHDPHRTDSLSNDIVNGLTWAADGRLWILTNEGADLLDPKTGRLTRWNGLPDEVVDALAIDPDGTHWFATYRAGLVRRPAPGAEGPEVRYLHEAGRPSSLPDNLVYFVQRDSQGRLWVGTNGGLALYRPATDDFQVWRYNPEDPAGLPGNTVRRLIEDRRGRLWVVVNGGGLSLLDPDTGRITNYGLQEGLTSLSVLTGVEDRRGQLWIGSANGLFVFNPELGQFRRYGAADGLAVTEFAAGAAALADGRLAFGTAGGLVTVRPEALEGQDSPPLVALSGVAVAGRDRLVTDHLQLGWQENAVTFQMAVLDFRQSTQNLYAYRLQGFDKEWVEAGRRREATYTNLLPGTYQFQFRGASASGVWNQGDRTVELVVEAAPWASWYAFLFYGVLAFLLVYLFQRARISRYLGRRVEELERLRSQLEEANKLLDERARLDGLTGIPNRRTFDAWLGEEWGRAQRQKQTVALLMIDIDDFKRFNDSYGHPEGDRCLKLVAKTLSDHLHRTADFAARYGGEEFVVVLHDTDLEGAQTVANRLRDAVDALAIPHETATARPFVTVSIGVAVQVPGPDRHAADLVQAADQALYRAKALGRHLVVCH